MLGIEKGIWIIIAAVVMLIVAVVLISIFTGGAGKFGEIFNQWMGSAPGPDRPAGCIPHGGACTSLFDYCCQPGEVCTQGGAGVVTCQQSTPRIT